MSSRYLTKVASLAFMIGCAPAFVAAEEPPAGQGPELAARMAAEKTARRACKIEICKALATPGSGAPITCDVTKTWLKDEITGRVVGGSYVWGYGNMQCSLKLKLDRAELGKALSEASATLTFPEHQLVCNIDDKDPAKGRAFSVTVSLTPVATFEKGEAKSVSLVPVKTEGSTLASAAVASLMAVDKVSGVVSRATASEINTFIFDKCKADGVEIVRK